MEYILNNPDRITELLLEHLALLSVSFGIALCISLPLGIWLSKHEKLYASVISVLGIMYTIPSIALFVLLIPFLGLGFDTAITALVIYAQMILVRNIVAGIKGIHPSIIEAARGMGMNSGRVLRKIIIPLSLPVIIAGIRISIVSMIGIGTLAAFISAGGLGELIFEGIYQDNPAKIYAGTISIAFLAIFIDILFRLLLRRVGRSH